MFKVGEIQGWTPLFLVFKNNLNPFYWHIWCIKNHQKHNKIEKKWPFKVEGINNSKKKPPNAIKIGSQTPKKLFLCCSIAIKVQRWFLELQMALL
jgi:hypothetical protein